MNKSRIVQSGKNSSNKFGKNTTPRSITLLLSIILTAIVSAYFLYSPTVNKTSSTKNFPTIPAIIESPTPTQTETISQTTPPSVNNDISYSWGNYLGCRVYSRSNMNTNGSNVNMLDTSSEIRCKTSNREQTVVSVTDKAGFESAKNSIFRFWHDDDGYKVLIVDQNGAGSGEGSGKVLTLQNKTYFLQSCFYFVWERFNTVNIPIKFGSPLTAQEIQNVDKNSVDKQSPYCSNFIITSTIE